MNLVDPSRLSESLHSLLDLRFIVSTQSIETKGADGKTRHNRSPSQSLLDRLEIRGSTTGEVRHHATSETVASTGWINHFNFISRKRRYDRNAIFVHENRPVLALLHHRKGRSEIQ